jgi:flagellar hook-length control protein FliK
MANPEAARSPLTPDVRSVATDTVVVAAAAGDRTSPVETGRPAVVTGKAEVWLQQPVELPEHIVEHVNRLHAQSLRLHAAGFTDLVQRLTLSIHPEDLGQVDVDMRSGEQLNVTFFARETGTRDLLEQNLPRLRQLFESQGLSLGDVNVGAGQAHDRQAAEGGREQRTGTRAGIEEAGIAASSSAGSRRGGTATRGLIDVLA